MISKKSKYSDLAEKAKKILLDKSIWKNDEGWVLRQEFHMKFLPLICIKLACRYREQERTGSSKPESLADKIFLGQKRICQHVENQLQREVATIVGEEYIRLRVRGKKKLIFTHAEKSMTLSAWADEIGVKKDTLLKRIRDGWTLEKTLSTPAASRESKEKNMVLITGWPTPLDLLGFFQEEWKSRIEIKGKMKDGLPRDIFLAAYESRKKVTDNYMCKKHKRKNARERSEDQKLASGVTLVFQQAKDRYVEVGLVEANPNLMVRKVPASAQSQTTPGAEEQVTILG